ncbi:MAG: AAA family ATPase [Candidatus Caldarchaeales archaeon]|jgi:MoxR-like ATPase
MDAPDLKDLVSKIKEQVHRAIVGMEDAIEALIVCLLAEGHLLLEGPPGLAKTYLVKSFARALDLSFSRIQFTSDLLPSDVTGSVVYDRSTSQFVFRRGPVFANVVLADEINRGPPRTQSALLEVMQERQVTVEGVSYPLPRPFMVIATQNPIEFEGTFPLPEAEMDRFLMRVIVTYPSREEEVMVLRLKQLQGEEPEVSPVADSQSIADAIRYTASVYVDESIMNYIVDIVRRTRELPDVLIGGSTRAEVALMYAARAKAAISGYRFVTPDHVKSVAPLVLNHRIVLRTRRTGFDGEATELALVKRVLEEVEVPV